MMASKETRNGEVFLQMSEWPAELNFSLEDVTEQRMLITTFGADLTWSADGARIAA
jgi:hypothetical protein